MSKTFQLFQEMQSINKHFASKCDAYLNTIVETMQSLEPKETDTDDVLLFKVELIEFMATRLKRIPE